MSRRRFKYAQIAHSSPIVRQKFVRFNKMMTISIFIIDNRAQKGYTKSNKIIKPFYRRQNYGRKKESDYALRLL